MASTTYLAVCCLGNQSSLINGNLTRENASLEGRSISAISLTVSLASILGTLILRLPCRSSGHVTPAGRQGHIVQSNGVNQTARCLVAAGTLANIGLVVRCSVWLAHYYPHPDDNDYQDARHIFCIVSTMWVQYFFLSVIFWHLVYGVETFMASVHSTSSTCMKYFLGWVVPGALTAISAALAYCPSLKSCGAKKPINRAIVSVIFLLPVVLVVLFISVLFYKSLNNVKRSLIRHFGRFSTMERETLDNISVKFIIITTAFIVCWIPNIVSGVFINVLDGKSKDIILIFLVLESVFNPFQVMIDSMVMFGWPPSGCCGIFRSNLRDNSNYANINNLTRSRRSNTQASEVDPLLSFSQHHQARHEF